MRVAIPVLLCLAAAAVTVHATDEADLILVGAPVYTMLENSAPARAIAVAGGRVIVAGSRDDAMATRGSTTRVVELDPGDCVIPGLVDSHAHLLNLGKLLTQVSLVGLTSKAQCIDRIREHAGNVPEGRWIEGRGWDQNDWPVREFPTLHDLEGISSNPIYLRRIDGHAAWVNRAALAAAGITRDTPDPDGGRIVRDEAGEPTGILIDNAEDLVTARIPEGDSALMDERMRAAVRHCAELGLVGVHDAGTRQEMLDSYQRLADAGELPLRVYCMLDGTKDALLERYFDGGPAELARGRIVVRAVKLYADGAMGSRGAALLAPYSDDAGNDGLMVTSPERMRSVVSRAHAAGFQPCIHAIGDRGNRAALDVYAAVLGDDPEPQRHRFRIEHCQMLAAGDFERYRDLGVVAAMQPTHATSDMYWVEERVGAERVRGAYAWRRFLDLGVVVAFGSDFPVESANPLWGIYAAVTRQDHDGVPEGGWYPDQRLSIEEAVRAFAAGAAFAGFDETEGGILAPGKRADIVVLDHDIFTQQPRVILDTAVRMTISDGAVVYERD